MPPLQPLRDALLTLADPWIFMSLSASFLPATLRRLRATHQLLPALLSWPRFRSAWFALFWAWAGPQVRSTGEARVVPLLRGRVSAGDVLPAAAAAAAPPVSGTVLEVGAGTGMWVSVFADPRLTGDIPSAPAAAARPRKSQRSSTITRVLGVEPNPAVQEELRANIAAAGLEGVYEARACGIQDLTVAPGSVDSVVCILVLCGIPDPERNIRALYDYLKPGGRMYVYEHVVVGGSWRMGLYQALVNVFWPQFTGGCQLRRNTEKYLREAGPWARVDLGHPSDESWYSTCPHILGILTK